MHEAPTGMMTGAYQADEYLDDLLRVTGGHTNPELARLVIRETLPATAWMERQGVRFQPALEGTLHLGRTNAFFLGGGKALLNTYYAAARRHGIHVLYRAEVTGLDVCGARFRSGTVILDGKEMGFRAKAIVVAAGGFESNLEWLQEAWGDAARNFLIRGTPYNQGKLLRILLAHGAASAGHPTQCHAVAIDGRAPKFDGGIVTRLDCVPLGIVVNRRAQRFYDEGEDLWPKRYAIWGRLVAQQTGQIAFSITDAKVVGRYMPSVFPPIAGNTIAELARSLELPVDCLEQTVREFNRAVVPGKFDHLLLDDCHTNGLTPRNRTGP